MMTFVYAKTRGDLRGGDPDGSVANATWGTHAWEEGHVRQGAGVRYENADLDE